MVRSAAAKSLLELIRSRRAKTGVIGLGYVGLPLAVEFGRAGYTAIGFDLDSRKVDAINEGRSYIDDVPTAHVAELRAASRLLATTVLCVDRGILFVLRWSCWRRRHQARAELSHYQRRGELRDHPSHRMLIDRTPKDQLEALL